jgi:Ca2+-binding EF-hand superfamily protein
LNDRHFGDSLSEAKAAFEAHKRYVTGEKPQKQNQKLDLEANYAEIQTKLSVYGRSPYAVPAGLSTEDLDAAWDRLEKAEKARGQSVRDAVFRFITKATSTVSAEQIREFEASFSHFDKDGSGTLDRLELKAAFAALSMPFKDDDAFNRVYVQITNGANVVSKHQFVEYLIAISEDKDTADAIKAAFQLLADQGVTIAKPQLRVHPLKDSEIEYLGQRMPATGSEVYDYVSYVDAAFK